MAYPLADVYKVESGKSIFAGRPYNVAHVYIMAGQSNCSGRAPISGAPPDTNPLVGVSCFKRPYRESGVGSWQPLNHQTNAYDADATNKMGAELQLMTLVKSKYYIDGPDNVFLIKVAEGATNLANDWAPGSSLRLALQYHIDSALNSLRSNASFQEIRVYGFYWDQGEYDANNEARSLAYESNLTSFVSYIRGIVGVPYLPFVARRMQLGQYSHSANVVAAQDAVAGDDPNFHLTNETFTHIGDNVHLDAPAQILQGGAVFNILDPLGGFLPT